MEPSAVRAQPRGSVPTLIAFTTLFCTRLTTETVAFIAFVTNAKRSLGLTATQRGSSPTVISASLLLTSLPFGFLTLMIERLFAPRLTTTTRVSSEVRAMVVERPGAAVAECQSAISTVNPAAAAMNQPVLLHSLRRAKGQNFIL